MSEPVFLFGSGGHAKVVIDVLRSTGVEVIACLVPDAEEGLTLGSIPVLDEVTGLAALRAAGHERAFVAIGDNRVRKLVADRARASGLVLVNAVSSSAILAPDVALGTGVLIVHGAIVNAAARIGDDVIVNTGATIDHDDVIGAAAHVAPGSHLAGGVTIGSAAMIGIGSVAIPGITIGEGAVVGAGSVVVRDIRPHARAWGNPARERTTKGESSL